MQRWRSLTRLFDHPQRGASYCFDPLSPISGIGILARVGWLRCVIVPEHHSMTVFLGVNGQNRGDRKHDEPGGS